MSAHQHLYNHRWRKARLLFLTAHPFCVLCEAEGHLTAAAVVDHHPRHNGDAEAFWDERTWRALCKEHHDRDAQSEEKGGVKHLRGCDAHGNPLHRQW